MLILLADDDPQLATFLSKSLESEGYSVHTALDESSVMNELKRQNYQLIILDLNFGPTDGLKLLEKLRANGVETPVLVLSARNRVSDRIESLNLGADDYVTKPFSFQELAARANAILRRKADPSLNVLRLEDLELDPLTRKVHRGTHEIKLSPKEFDMLHLLMRRAGETVSRQQLLQECWETTETDSNLVDVYVNYLRKKVEAGQAKMIFTVRGSGYRLGAPATGAQSPAAADHEHGVIHLAHRIPGPGSSPQPSGSELTTNALRALIHAIAHDLAQPLTSVRCFLEMLSIRKTPGIQPADLKTIEQQADRAIALAKGISAVVRDSAAADSAWISLEALFNEIFSDFSVLQHSGLLTVQRLWDPSVQVSSSPVLRQVLVLLLSKLTGRNARPMVLTLAAESKDGRCQLELRWRPADSVQKPLPDAANILTRERSTLKEIVFALGGELVLPEGECRIVLRLPGAQALAPAAGFVQ
ncbi:MAG TPA: response regulator [Candidatus Angelobacter sp.]|nr:response regulator [Candidatus Angelobacter sp.]